MLCLYLIGIHELRVWGDAGTIIGGIDDQGELLWTHGLMQEPAHAPTAERG